MPRRSPPPHLPRALQEAPLPGPPSGFYEWKRLDSKNRQPFAFDLSNGKMMTFAGLWDAWKDPANGQWLQSYTIITTDANELMAPLFCFCIGSGRCTLLH